MIKKKSKKKGNKLSSKQLQREILKLFKRNPKKQFNPKQVAKKLKVANNKDSFEYAMQQLAEEGHIVTIADYKYKLKGRAVGPRSVRSVHEGIVDMTRTGSAYVVCDDLENDVHVAAKLTHSALHGDKVQIKVWTPRGRRRAEGEVIKVLERAKESFIGTYWIQKKYGVVVPDSNTPLNIIVDFDDAMDANDGEKVVVKVDKWATGRHKDPLGKITTVLGASGSNEIEMKAILINNGFNLTFPDEVLAESNSLSTKISRDEIAKRRDMREVLTFTIDPDTAKDFDDALSLEYLKKGEFEIGVHIADVSHYVQQGSPLDKEAYSRSTSVYLVDRVLPMLPEKLSNELCSLRPEEDKLTFSAIFRFNKDNQIVDRWFGKTIIHSDRRFTYEEAQQTLESGEGDFAAELKQLNKIAYKLRKRRFKKGAINFETEEVKFRLDENGAPVEVYIKDRKDAHLLVEDFMLLANREVATYIVKKDTHHEIPFVYRIHDEPNPDKVEELARFAKEMGFEMNISSPKEIAKSYNKLVKAKEQNPIFKLLEPIAIRTMAKAIYSTENIGHYGLGFDYYTHFTSPIRRYSDVLAHRILEKNLDNGNSVRLNQAFLEEQCDHISKQERRAMDAERESVKYKQVEFMEKHVGSVFPGFISGFNDRGIFVELQGNRCEGMVSFETLNEPFEVSNSRLSVKGIRSEHEYRMGESVLVQILDTDLSRRRIDMKLVIEAEEADWSTVDSSTK